MNEKMQADIQIKIEDTIKYFTENNMLCLVTTIPNYGNDDADDEVIAQICSNGDNAEQDLLLLANAADMIKKHYGLSGEMVVGAINFYLKMKH